MRDYLILVGVQLKGLFGINRFFRQKGSGAGKTARAVGASLLILFAIAFFVGAAALYNYFFLADLHVSAREDLLYSAAFGFLFLILLLTYLFLTAGSLYGGKDYELLASCPVSHRTVVLSKLTGYYLIGLLITVVYMVPAMVFYALYASVSPFFYPVAVCNLLFIPMFPLAASLEQLLVIGIQLLAHDRIRILQDLEFLGRHLADDADCKSWSRERLAMHDVIR